MKEVRLDTKVRFCRARQGNMMVSELLLRFPAVSNDNILGVLTSDMAAHYKVLNCCVVKYVQCKHKRGSDYSFFVC